MMRPPTEYVLAVSGWWESFFTGSWETAQLGLWTEEDNRAAADKVERALQLSALAKVLDAPCGDGRISVELAARGHEVSGVDLNETFLAAATRKAVGRGVRVDWQRHDMRDLPFESGYDAAYNFGGSFGYFDERDNARTAASMYRALREGGRFLIDVPSPETVFPGFRDRLWFSAGDVLVVSENRYDHDSGRIETDWTIIAADRPREYRHSSIRLYTYHELVELLRGVGFVRIEAFDAAELGPFRVGASRLIAVATK
jgi:SAM-dependent methyltransferase